MSQFSVGQAVIDIRGDDSGLREAEPRVRRTMEGIRRVMLRAAAAASTALVAAGAFAVNAAAQFEQTEIAMTTLLGSATRARDMLAELSDFAAKTPFQFSQLAGSARLMLALGFAAEDVLPTMRALGDATSALGGNDELLRRIILALGQMDAKGKVSAEEMRQLSEAGIPGWELLADIVGTDIPTAMKMAENGAIRAATVVPQLIAAIGKRFEGAMDDQSRTMIGILSNLKDEIEIQSRGIGNAIIENLGLKEILTDTVALIQRFGPAAVEATKGITSMLVPAATFVASLALWSRLTPLVLGGMVRMVGGARVAVVAIMGLRAAMLAANTATFLFYTQIGRLNIFLTGKTGWLAATAMLKLFASRAAIARVGVMALTAASAALNAVLMGTLIGGLAIVTAGMVHARMQSISYGEALLDLAHRMGIFTTSARRLKDAMDDTAGAAMSLAEAQRELAAAQTLDQELVAHQAIAQAIRDRMQAERQQADIEAQQARERIRILEEEMRLVERREELNRKFGSVSGATDGMSGDEVRRELALARDQLRLATDSPAMAKLRDQLTEAENAARRVQERMVEAFSGSQTTSAIETLGDKLAELQRRMSQTVGNIQQRMANHFAEIADQVFEFTRSAADVERRDTRREADELTRQTNLAQLMGQLAPEVAAAQLEAIQRALTEKLAAIDERENQSDAGSDAEISQRATFVGVADAFNRLQASIFKGDEQRRQTAAAEKAAKSSEDTASAAGAIETMMGQAVTTLGQINLRLNPSPLGA